MQMCDSVGSSASCQAHRTVACAAAMEDCVLNGVQAEINASDEILTVQNRFMWIKADICIT